MFANRQPSETPDPAPRPKTVPARFQLGRLYITCGAVEQISDEDVQTALWRHVRGDWGELSPADQRENEVSVAQGFRILSAYQDRHGTKFWIITEADRSATTVLLPEEY